MKETLRAFFTQGEGNQRTVRVCAGFDDVHRRNSGIGSGNADCCRQGFFNQLSRRDSASKDRCGWKGTGRGAVRAAGCGWMRNSRCRFELKKVSLFSSLFHPTLS